VRRALGLAVVRLVLWHRTVVAVTPGSEEDERQPADSRERLAAR
jgi:hypothetical protein